jgi:hypothetical protein
MGNFWILIIAPVALLGAWLFMTVHDEQSAKQEAVHVEMQRDRAEFDRDFSKAWNGKADPALEARASEASQKMGKAEAEKARVEAQRKAELESEKKELGSLLKGGEK